MLDSGPVEKPVDGEDEGDVLDIGLEGDAVV